MFDNCFFPLNLHLPFIEAEKKLFWKVDCTCDLLKCSSSKRETFRDESCYDPQPESNNTIHCIFIKLGINQARGRTREFT